MANCFSLPTHSIMIKKKIRKIIVSEFVIPTNPGAENKDLENIFFTNPNASLMLEDLKNIQAKTVSKNVIIIEKKSRNVGNSRPLATISRLFLWVFKIMEGIIYKAFKNPQKMKVQFAPCQKPLTKNIINVFLIFIQVPPLLPPSGMYK